MNENELINEIICDLEKMKAERLKKSCSRDALNQANAFQICIAIIKKKISEHESKHS